LNSLKDTLRNEFDDKYPFLLFPVRIETRFMEVPYPPELATDWAYSANVSETLLAISDARDGINTVLAGGPYTPDGRLYITNTFSGLAATVTEHMQNIGSLVVSEKFKIETEAGFLMSKMKAFLDQADTEKSKIQGGLDVLATSQSEANVAMSTLQGTFGAIGSEEQSKPEGAALKLTTHLDGIAKQMSSYAAGEQISLDERRRALADFIIHSEKLNSYMGEVSHLSPGDNSAAQSLLTDLNNNLNNIMGSLGEVMAENNNVTSELDSVVSVLQGHYANLEALVDGLAGLVMDTAPGLAPDGLAPGHMLNGGAVLYAPTTTELWVRIYPDEIMVEGHEPGLTQSEIDAGQDYWNEIWVYPNDPETLLTSWTTLAEKFHPQRAAWIVEATKPTNLASRPSGSPSFASITPSTATLGTSPESHVVPDRFVVIAYDSMNSKIEWVGKPVTNPLTCGIDPSASGAFSWDANGDLSVDPNIKWMFDFNEAYENGMALRVPLENGFEDAGIKRLFVLGIRTYSEVGAGSKSAPYTEWNATQSRSDLETLIDSHHYSLDGFSIVPQGTPTNNTESGL